MKTKEIMKITKAIEEYITKIFEVKIKSTWKPFLHKDHLFCVAIGNHGYDGFIVVSKQGTGILVQLYALNGNEMFIDNVFKANKQII